MDYTGKKVMIGLSAGINSAAVLVWLAMSGQKPSELHLFYAHLREHSPDSFSFVADCIRYAREHFPCVKVKITRGSVLELFARKQMIPHPTTAPCTHLLKIEPMIAYCYENAIQHDLVGYVRKEKHRINRMRQSGATNLFLSKDFPISLFDDEWCFKVVDEHIGWHPAIYDIRDENGKRVFKHNNCLPCKNMYVKDMLAVQKHYPAYWQRANDLSKQLQAYWGRSANDYYTTFGREDYEPQQCETCSFD